MSGWYSTNILPDFMPHGLLFGYKYTQVVLAKHQKGYVLLGSFEHVEEEEILFVDAAGYRHQIEAILAWHEIPE